MKDIYSNFNYIDLNRLDYTYQDGVKCIDTIAASDNILQCIEGLKLLEINEIIDTNHQSYIVDVNMEHYFSKEFSEWDIIDRYLLNSSRHSYKEAFKEYADEILDQIPIEEAVEKF